MQGIPDALSVGVIGLIVTILVALISGIVSMVGLIISKEQKVSDFRQAWIDALRDDISHFVSHPLMISAYNLLVLKPKLQELGNKLAEAREPPRERELIEQEIARAISEFYVDMKEDYSKINIYSTRIKLRLNDDAHESDSRALLSVLARMEGFFSDIRSLEDRAVQDAVSEIEEISRPLLKKEWERVKRGERTFRVAKYVSLAVSGIIVLAMLGLCLSLPAYLLGYATSQGNSQHVQNCPANSLPSTVK